MLRSRCMPKEHDIVADAKRVARWASIAGVVIAFVCHFVPPHYRAACNAVAAICTGGH